MALLLTCIIGATAADFVPTSGAKYLIKCKANNRVAYTPDNNTILNAKAEVTEASYFSIESKVVENVTYFYIHPAADATKYVYTAKTPSSNNDENDGVVGVTSTLDDATCLWKITTNGAAFNITPKGYDNYSWNCRNSGIGYWHTGGNGKPNNVADNQWYISPIIDLDGYYTIKTVATDRYQNLYNDLSQTTSMMGQTLPSPLTNNYVWHITSNNNTLSITNGQGTPVSTDVPSTFSTLNVAWSDGTNCVFAEALNAGNDARNYKLTTWADGGLANDNQWNFTKVEADNVYTVECNIADGCVTYNTTGEKAKNTGFFITSATPAASDFTAADVKYYDAAVALDGNTIKVTYTYNLEGLKALATEALSHKGVGYPTENAATRTALAAAVAGTDAAAIATALDAFKTSTADIQMPQDGKAYRIKVPYISGTTNYLYCNGEKIGNKSDDNITDKNDEVFVCHVVNGKYVFATNHGTYLNWADSNDDNKSYTTSAQTSEYVAQNDWTIEPATLDKGKGTVSLTNRTDVFGLVQMKALAKDGTTTYYLNSRINDAFISSSSADKYYDTGWANWKRSCYYQFEEVEYPNTVTFTAATGIDGVSHIATFSAPFATIIPEGVKAYYVSAKDTKATMTAIDAEAIPANQGVILTSESGDAATMVPAAAETAATITANQLGHSAGAAKSLTAGEGYILANGTEGIAFYPCTQGTLAMNKAYLTGNGSAAITMDFNNTVTAISAITTNAAPATAPIYDLSGRRVMKAAKSGLYIQNGHKFIVK